ncbi:MAG TPA: 4-hydroxy-tetrahydrodipicolinate reductase [Actinomycetota bacterium]|nr:4-hydroxy-tetrahydrodipicolinate reductase [Actinomycetota bacterium]
MATVRVGVLGAGGRMGSETCRAVDADPDLELVARVGRGDPLETLVSARAEVAVEFTTPESVKENVRFCLSHGIHCVVGATGLSDADLEDVGSWTGPANALVAPNFALGAVLMMSFAAAAAKHFDTAEIVERHHERKLDAPSGTALRTARLMSEAREGRAWSPARGDETVSGSRGGDAGGVRIHSLRLPGSVAHQEVVLGAAGETLTIRHDSIDRTSFMPGVVLACKRVGRLDGLVVGLENVLDL